MSREMKVRNSTGTQFSGVVSMDFCIQIYEWVAGFIVSAFEDLKLL